MTYEELSSKLENVVRERSSNKNPMYYHALKDYTWSKIVCALANGKEPDAKDWDYVCGVKNRRSSSIQSVSAPTKLNNQSLPDEVINMIDDGVKVMDILDKYRDTIPNLHKLLSKAVIDKGFRVEGFYIRKD